MHVTVEAESSSKRKQRALAVEARALLGLEWMTGSEGAVAVLCRILALAALLAPTMSRWWAAEHRGTRRIRNCEAGGEWLSERSGGK